MKMGLRIGLVLSGVNAFIDISEFPCCSGSTLALRFFAGEDVTQHPGVPPVRNAHLN
jgi:hypothetical protein